MATTSEHWIEGWDWSSAREIPREEAQKHELYSRVWLRDDGSVERLEAYRQGALKDVVYHDFGSDAEILAFHTQHHPGVRRKEIRRLAQRDGFVWSRFVAFYADGSVVRRALTLDDADGRVLMEIDRDGDGRATLFTKYFWPDADTLRFIFEYNAEGRLVYIEDLVEHERADFDDVAPLLPDARFYADGWALPAPLAGTAIPELP